MAKYSSADFEIWFDNASDTLVEMSSYITDADPFDKERAIEETTAFSASDETYADAGVNKHKEKTLKGFYDDTVTTGPHVIFNAEGSTRTLKYIYGGGKSDSQEHIITSYRRLPKVKGLTGFEVKLQPTGVVTEV